MKICLSSAFVLCNRKKKTNNQPNVIALFIAKHSICAKLVPMELAPKVETIYAYKGIVAPELLHYI